MDATFTPKHTQETKFVIRSSNPRRHFHWLLKPCRNKSGKLSLSLSHTDSACYTFQSIGLLRRAMTHSSFSEENNKALSILGASTIETSVSLQYLKKDIEASAKDLNRRISEISQVESSCAVDAMRLGLQKVIRVSPKTNASTPAVVCGAFRAIFGAIAMDTGKSDDAGKVFWSVHGSEVGGAAAL
ncbi:Protein nuclear fusion defective 2 [Vitis vinifera]|uniref:Protein nuclear fusion defective 2 n=1 Tax=Vitis vinifera TaxID=29760 RepID=A0A438KBK7_VITVI|nr:Protein nuclear fusion defective 2 [Vitis vinifera]